MSDTNGTQSSRNKYDLSRDWIEDFEHENGEYQCRCVVCGEIFFGHKRRVTCRDCAVIENTGGQDENHN